MKVQRHYNISAEGHEVRARIGNQNLQRFKSGELQPSEIEADCERLRTQLEERASALPEPTRSLLINAAIATHAKIAIIKRQNFRTSRLTAKAQPYGDDLAPLTSNLIRTLKALGLVADSHDDEERGPDLKTWWAERQKAKQAEAEASAASAGVQP